MAGAGACVDPGAPNGPPPPVLTTIPDTGGPQPGANGNGEAKPGWPWWVWVLIVGGALYLLSDSEAGGAEE